MPDDRRCTAGEARSSGARDHRTVLGRLVSRSLDIAFPATCAGCGREGDPICPACRPALDARLALPPGVPIGLPAELPPGLLQVEWCAPFGGVVRTALHQLKYAGERRLSRPLGQAIARRWAAVGAGGDILVPVPVHAERAAQRGYDQAVLLAETAATALGVPAATVLARRRATVAQYHLDRADRAANVAGAFALASPAASAAVRGPMGRAGRRRHDDGRHALARARPPSRRPAPSASRRSPSPGSADPDGPSRRRPVAPAPRSPAAPGRVRVRPGSILDVPRPAPGR